MPEATLQKKHTAISFHRVRECKDNFTDIFTKSVDGTSFKYHAWNLMWKTQQASNESIAVIFKRSVNIEGYMCSMHKLGKVISGSGYIQKINIEWQLSIPCTCTCTCMHTYKKLT